MGNHKDQWCLLSFKQIGGACGITTGIIRNVQDGRLECFTLQGKHDLSEQVKCDQKLWNTLRNK